MFKESKEIIEFLDLIPHPEGGYYRQTYVSSATIPSASLPSTYPSINQRPRFVSTCIYFMIEQGNFSAFHMLYADEIWHYYQGDPLEVIVIDPHANGEITHLLLGNDFIKGQQPQRVVPAGTWFASRVLKGGKFSLVGATVAPGFDFEDFALAKRKELVKEFPQHEDIISKLTRQ